MSEARDVMHRADGLRERARALSTMIIRMRVRERPTQRGPHFFSRGRDAGDREVHLTQQEDQLFYEWCCEKKAQYEREADELDATLRVEK